MNKDEIIRSVESEFIKDEMPNFSPGDVIRVYERISPLSKGKSDQEASGSESVRTQIFEGIVLKRSGGGTSEMFTVRKDSFGIGIEKIFPLHSPRIEKIELVQKGTVHQARPYYLRRKTKRKPKRRAPTGEEMGMTRRKTAEKAEPERLGNENKEEEFNE